MKFVSCLVMFFAAQVLAGSAAHLESAGQDKAITKVVKLLQGMLDKSKADADEEEKLFAKHKCYCDDNTAEKETTIETKTKEIAALEAAIDKLKADNAKLSQEVAKLEADMAANKASQADATSMRDKENTAFKAEKKDLEQAIGQMEEAIDVLAAVSADQTAGDAAADHSKFMSGYGKKESLMSQTKLIKFQAQMKTALSAAAAFVPEEKRRSLLSLMQAPFTGSYTSQSVEVVGILKEMLDTFKANLKSAVETEAKALAAYTALMKTLEDEYTSMETLNGEKQSTLSANDAALAAKKESLDQAISDKADAEDFLGKLTVMCKEKAEEYNSRKLMRTNEDAAIAQAIAILNSDAAYETFSTVDATSTGATSATGLIATKSKVSSKEDAILALSKSNPSFLQLAGETNAATVRRHVEEMLGKVSTSKQSMRVARVLAMLQAGNPFKVVLEEIDKMMALIDEEGKHDKENLDFCNTERTTTDASIQAKDSQILSLTQKKDTLTETIEDPATGLKFLISENEASLKANAASKEEKTKQRSEETLAYQADVKNLVEAEDLLTNAIGVLKNYYTALEKKLGGGALLQKREDPAPPATWEAGYKGQSEKGTDAISMLEYILSETKKEEAEAHTEEKTAQHSYEDDMTSLMADEKTLQESNISLNKQLADAEKSLQETIESLEQTGKEKAALEEYLESIKPGCDFITANFPTRESSRAEETASLKKAKDLLKGTPAFKAAMDAAHEESLGDCKDVCLPKAKEDEAPCKACLAGVTVPGYCAGNPGTAGCPTK